MTDTFRALCAELVDDLELCDWPYKLKGTIRADIERARALLAEPVGEGVLPLKGRPDFIAGYREGLADRRRIIECEEAERPAAQPVAEGPSADELIGLALRREPWATWIRSGGCLESAHCELADLMLAVLDRWGHQPAPPGEERIGNWLLPEKPPLPEHWSGDLEYGFETAWETARALLQQRHPAPMPVSELPQGWHMLCDIEPEPGAMCDWVIMAPWGCDHGSGEWRDYNGVSPCEFLDVPVGWPVSVYYKVFASADGVMVSDPKLTAWRALPLPAGEVGL